MNTITIQVASSTYEITDIVLSESQVRQLYLQKTADTAKITELEKEVAKQKNYYENVSEREDMRIKEINEANTLLTALNVPAKTDAPDDWARKELSLVTRIALYIAQKV